MWAAGGEPASELRQTLPKLRRLLIVSLFVSVGTFLAQNLLLRRERAADRADEAVVVSRARKKAGALQDEVSPRDEDTETSVEHRNGPGGKKGAPALPQRRGDAQLISLVMVLFGLSMTANESRMRRKLFTFAGLTFVNFATNLAVLLHKAEIPPGPRHLLSTQCPTPVSEIAHFVHEQQRWFHSRILADFPNGRGLLPQQEDGMWSLALPDRAVVDLCSASWAMGNAYLIFSSVLVLWMHAYVHRMLHSISLEGLEGDADFADAFAGGGAIWPAGQAVIVLNRGMPAPTAAARHRLRNALPSFVPFTGQARTLDF